MKITEFYRPVVHSQESTSNANAVPTVPTDLPRSRSTVEEGNGKPSYNSILRKSVKFVGPNHNMDYIPVIRKLAMSNPDVGLALFDAVALTNTGFRLKFDPGVKADQVDKMRTHIEKKALTWGYGGTGLHELVNKFIRQAYISGAISHEWVVDGRRRGIKDLKIVNPETITFAWTKGEWVPYQRVKADGINEKERLVRLNKYTFKYLGLNNDSNIPYGVPPYLNAMDSLARQLSMNENVDYVLDQLGVLGFLETLVEKPQRKSGEDDVVYTKRLQSLLATTKENTLGGFKKGMVTGFKGDHEFNFHSTTKEVAGVEPIIKTNEVQVANGLKMSPVFLGVPISGSESGMSVTFTKMLAQLTNTQNAVAASLKYGLALELRLAGFNFKYLEVEFNPSTITDDLKMQQGTEIKIRNQRQLRMDGIIGQEQYAEALGYEKPYQAEPVVPFDQQVGGKGPSDEEADRKKKEADSDKSDRKSRDKGKTQPKRRDADTKER